MFEEIRNHNQTVAAQIIKGFGVDVDIEKARSGVYADTSENRRLNRVGMQYGSKKNKEESKGNGDRSSDVMTEKNIKSTFDKIGFSNLHSVLYKWTRVKDLDIPDSEKEVLQKLIKNGLHADTVFFSDKNEKDREEHKREMNKRGYEVFEIKGESNKCLFAVIKKSKLEKFQGKSKDKLEKKSAKNLSNDKKQANQDASNLNLMDNEILSDFSKWVEGDERVEALMEILDTYDYNHPKVVNKLKQYANEYYGDDDNIWELCDKYDKDTVIDVLVEGNSGLDENGKDQDFPISKDTFRTVISSVISKYY